MKNFAKSFLIYFYRFCSVFRRVSQTERVILKAIDLKRGRIDQEEFRSSLDAFYANLDLANLKQEIDVTLLSKRISPQSFFKTDVLISKDVFGGGYLGFKLLSLLRHWNIRFDLLELQAGQEIPPHMHRGVVSGFMLVEGDVRIRHYDQIECGKQDTLVVKTIDRTLSEGEFTTNSEYRDNIHWLTGVAPSSYLFRCTITNIVPARFGLEGVNNPRNYVSVSEQLSLGETGRLQLLDVPEPSSAS